MKITDLFLTSYPDSHFIKSLKHFGVKNVSDIFKSVARRVMKHIVAHNASMIGALSAAGGQCAQSVAKRSVPALSCNF